MISRKSRRELLRFLVIGGIAFLIDAISYTILIKTEVLTPSGAKRLSAILASIWAFFMNKFYTFEQKTMRISEPLTFCALYVSSWLLNSFSHDLVLRWIGVKTFAFLVASFVSTCTNFIGQKWIVFRASGDIVV